jgi:leucine dehydrogenase
MTLSAMAERGHERVSFVRDEASGLACLVAIHDTRLGPAVGGTRMLDYDADGAPLRDALRLSEAMAYKTAAADLHLGGGKGVIVGDPAEKTDDLLRAFGRVVDSFDGAFVTGEDVNLDAGDVRTMGEVTPYVGGEETGEGAAVTARGVRAGMRACLDHWHGRGEFDDVHVAVQGVGKVGRELVADLVDAGAVVTVADVDRAAVERMVDEYGVDEVDPEAVYDVECDVFAPCALGGVLDDETVDRLRCEVVCGSANNQLEARRHADALAERGILYAPDFVVNAGGLLAGATEMEGGTLAEAYGRAEGIHERLAEMLDEADERGVTPFAAAEAYAERRMEDAGEPLLH